MRSREERDMEQALSELIELAVYAETVYQDICMYVCMYVYTLLYDSCILIQIRFSSLYIRRPFTVNIHINVKFKI